MNRSYKILLSLMFVLGTCISIYGQEKTVEGTVVSEESGPLPGVNVIIKGSKTGSLTDFDGKYSIKAKIGDILQYSYVGYYTKEIVVGTSNIIDVTLKVESNVLEEVVITAFGQTRQKRSTGYAATIVSAEQLTQVTTNNPFESLSGKIAGVDITAPAQPGASTKVIIRGFSSIKGSNSPLYIVDGSPINNSANGSNSVNRSFDGGTGINDLDPNNIASVNVLKGAAATALYGSRGSTGVIVITTKKGKSNSKIAVDINSSLEFAEVSRIPHMQNEFGQGWNGINYDGLPTGGTGASNQNGSWGPAFTGQIRLWGHIVNNSQQLKPYSALPNNVKDFYTIGDTYTNSVRLSGGGANSDFALGFTNTDSDGVVPTDADGYKRKALSFNGGLGNDKFKVRTAINFIKKDQNAVNTGQGDAAGQGNTFSQELIQVPRDISILDLKDYQNNVFNSNDWFYTPYASNPYWTINENSTNIKSNRVFGNVNLSYQLSSKFSASWQMSMDMTNQKTKSYGAVVKYSQGSAQQLLGTTPIVGGVTESQVERLEYDTFGVINYNFDVNNDLNIVANVGATFNQRSSDFLGATISILDIPNYYELSNSAVPPIITQNNTLRRTYGVFASATGSYKNRYFLSLTGRNDWSSTLPVANNSYFYPSVSLSGIVLEDNNSFLKLRGGFAQVANDTNPYNTESTLTQANGAAYFGNISFPIDGVNSFELSGQLGNNTLLPEITTEYEVGLEGRFFNSRISVDAAYYDKQTNDLLIDRLLPRSTGYSQVTGNFADVSNKGVELLLSGFPVRTNDLSWEVTYTFTKNRNKITDLRGLDKLLINSAYATNFYAEIGRPLGVFRFAGAETNSSGQIVVNSGTGLPVLGTEEQELGTSERDFVMGLQNSFKYKNITLSIGLDYKKGGKMYSYTNRLLNFTGNAISTTYNNRRPFIIPNSVNDNGDGTYSENTTPVNFAGVTNYFGAGSNPAYEAYHTIDKTFVRLRDLSLSYVFPASFTDKMKLSKFSVTLYGKNLALWTPEENPYVDPEISTYGSDLASEFGEFAGNPAQRSYGMSFKVSF
ncbi:SusC/RagA family TonB-linked outer membrane protein [Lutibacter maritimus]|uniref:TonB-linked outer membrane protein, SusC/RagA family n=1 Tax=Lutibacter maritimus TaxID=593133 RepID=A0A1I6RZF0_9FLAO|nr:SusC/RagA family TonB-linked outer membrane protein [Lutibacter maritimus]SFS69878.1 TonB-linked outer membrane protein, SusC/RagA family [Lutibacter maritimus]